MKTNTKTKETNQDRALWAACMGSMALASGWLKRAEAAVQRNETEAEFVALNPHSKPKARAAYRLAKANAADKSAAIRPANRIAGKCVIVFVRLFTAGTLKGMKVPDSIPHVDRWHAAQWLKGIRRNVRRGVLEYKLISAEGKAAL